VSPSQLVTKLIISNRFTFETGKQECVAHKIASFYIAILLTMPSKKQPSAPVQKNLTPRKGKRKGENSSAKSVTKNQTDTPDASDDRKEKVLTFSGAVPVDDECPLDSKTHHVLVEGNIIYNAMLNQTNIGSNNNKYYVLQVIKHNKKQEFFNWFRWGRVGKIVGTTLQPTTQKQLAIINFEKKFRDKTGNPFNCGTFTKVKGKYDLVKIDYGEEESKKKQEAPKSKKAKIEAPSTLDKRVQDIMKLIFDQDEWEEQVKEMKFDIKKAPLGKLTKQQVTAGYEALKKVEECIQKKTTGQPLIDACSEFYTKIPHDFGMKRPPLIATASDLKQKLQLLEALGDIQIAISLIDNEEEDENTNILDTHYKSLDCGLHPLEKDEQEFQNIQKYVQNTHGSTHNQYKLIIEDIFRVDRPSDIQRFKHEIGTRMLLWHGSRLTNWCGILKQGLRIAPPEAPVTGYMFGKGV